ncbi:MAG: TonB family protein [Bdellovibrionota bacterium]
MDSVLPQKWQSLTFSVASHLFLGIAIWVVLFVDYKTTHFYRVSLVSVSATSRQPEPKARSSAPRTPKKIEGIARTASNAKPQPSPAAPMPASLKPGDADPNGVPVPTEEFLVTKMPKLVSDVRIPYPEDAKSHGIQGAVILDLLVDIHGQVRGVEVIEGPGFGLNEAAQAASKAFVFEPAMVEDKPVPVKIRYSYRFILEK